VTASVFVTYDPAADAVYVYLMPQETSVDHTEEFGDHRIVDFDEQGRVVGIEFLEASRGLDFDGIPDAERVAEAIRSLAQLTPA
jgi:uncharacterized protein YuzE